MTNETPEIIAKVEELFKMKKLNNADSMRWLEEFRSVVNDYHGEVLTYKTLEMQIVELWRRHDLVVLQVWCETPDDGKMMWTVIAEMKK